MSSTTEQVPTAALNYYDEFGLSPSADAAVIRTRYRTLALENHPDRFDAPDQKGAATARFKRIREAYEVLADAEQRRRFDASLAAGRTFVPKRHAQADTEPSLADIFADVDRFPFPAQTSQISDEKLRRLINESIIQSHTLKEKVVAVYEVALSDVAECTSPTIRGDSVSPGHLVLTNFRVLVTVAGSSVGQSENTTYSRTYWAGLPLALMSVERIDFTVNAAGSRSFWTDQDQFGVTFYGPETPLAGTMFMLKGSAAPFVWLANLFAIPTGVCLVGPSNPARHQRAGLISAALAVAAALFVFAVSGSEVWANAPFVPVLLAAPILGLGVTAYLANARIATLAKLCALYGDQ
jgi:curved DNA-binding protein